jgi:arylsulfatase A-like enzyme
VLLPSHPALPLLALSCLAACGGSGSVDPESVRLVRVDLHPASPTEVASPPVEIRRWEGASLEELRPNRGSTVELVENALVLGEDTKRLTLSGLEGTEFDRVGLAITARGGRMKLGFSNARGVRIAQTPDSQDLPRNGRQEVTVVVDAQFLRPHAGSVDTIQLQFSACPKPPKITSVFLLRAEPESWLPSPDHPQQVMLGKDGRLASALSTRMALTASLTADETGGGLSFAFGIPPFLRRHAEGAELLLTVADRQNGRMWRERYDIPVGEWSSQTFWPPRDVTGSELELRFELRSPSAGEVVTCALSQPILEGNKKQPSTVLLITSDTHRADHMGMAPSSLAKTPFLDGLARRGVLFDDCQAEGNNTNPTHVSIMTGVSVRDHGIIGNDTSVGRGIETLTECFAKEGYQTFAALSATHLVWSGCEQGFDRVSYPTLPQHDSKETLKVLSSWLDESKHRQLFVWLHSFDPHAPYSPPAPWDKMYVREFEGPKPEGSRPKWASEVDDLREVIARYQGEVTYFDSQLQALFHDHPRLDDAVIAMVGDHGENFIHPEENWSWSHHGLSKNTLHVPLLFTWPGAPAAERVSRPVQQRDLGRTLLDIAGLGRVEFPGDNLLALAMEDPEEVGELPRFAIAGNAYSASVRRGNWMLVQGLYMKAREEGKRKSSHEVALYDTDKDPGCLVNLANENHELVCTLRTEVVRWLQEARIGTWGVGESIRDSASLKDLESLGYVATVALPDNNPWIDPSCDCEHCAAHPLVDQ